MTSLPGPDILVRTDRATRVVYATDNSIYQLEPAAVALPQSADDIVRLVADNAVAAQPQPIVARGGGTGTNGQSLTTGLMIDCKRHLNQIISLDLDEQTAWVEPGIVTDELNRQLAGHGLFWAPHTSTTSRATVGGMIATDAAGKGSLVHGRTHRHVLALDVVLADGSTFRAEPLLLAEAEARAAGDDRTAAVWQALLGLPLEEDTDLGLPELARGFSGYGIDRVRREGMIDPVPLLVGSEGTLAITAAAKIKLTPRPAHTVLVIAGYDSFDDALRDAVDLRSTEPTAIESFDERTLDAGTASPAWPALAPVVGDGGGSVLLLEYAGAEPVDTDAIVAAIVANGRSSTQRVVHDASEQKMAWKVRADAVGLLAKIVVGAPERSARPTAFVEDCAVPVANMCDFIADFRSALDDFGVEYAMFGHADVGCVHVRPALDLTDPAHETLVRSITDRVVEVIGSHGGVLWGEHGRGFRGDPVEKFLPEATIALMRQVKSIFDPGDLLNPGKLYRPTDSSEPIVALDAPPLRGHANRRVPLEVRSEYESAFACNGNGLCHHHSETEVMCPSYKASGDPALSPKGRADLMRAWLAGPADADFEDQMAENFGQCLSCSACTGRCPVEVDVTELKSQFLERYHVSRRRPLSHHVLRRFESLAVLAARTPRLARLGAGAAGRLLGLVDLTTPKAAVPHGAPTFSVDGSPVDLVVIPDVFTAVIEPATLAASVDVLRRSGFSVAVAPFRPSGKFEHVKGMRTAFAQAAAAQRQLVEEIAGTGARAVTIEPAVSLLHGHEYRIMDPAHPSERVHHLAEVLLERSDQIRPAAEPRQVQLFGHCTETALASQWIDAWEQLLRAAGHDVQRASAGCCGMAGIFGHERENKATSTQLWKMGWAKVIDTDLSTVATGYSCRSQAERHGLPGVDHPVHLL
jgi:FAD/FMN-containing dehydrogenase/Fe-S oxidoreductase